jgi:hypothetical protein
LSSLEAYTVFQPARGLHVMVLIVMVVMVLAWWCLWSWSAGSQLFQHVPSLAQVVRLACATANHTARLVCHWHVHKCCSWLRFVISTG